MNKGRPHVAARAAENRSNTFHVVKLSLARLLTDSGRTLPIQHAVERLKTLTVEAYMFANLLIVRHLEAGRPVPKPDQSFYYRCLCAVSDTGCRTDVDVTENEAVYNAMRPPEYQAVDRSHLAGMIETTARRMATATSNHILTNFYRRFSRYAKLCLDMDGREAHTFVTAVFAEHYGGSSPLVQHFRQSMPRPTTAALRSTPHLFFTVLWQIERFYGRHHDMRGVRGFSILPFSSGFAADHVKIDTAGLWSLLKASGIDVPGRPQFMQPEIRSLFWRSCFDVYKIETRTKKFADEIVTDGKAVSVLLKRPKRDVPDEDRELNPDDYDVAWGVDPGMRDMFVASSSDGQSARCSSGEFYNDAGYVRSQQRRRHWLRNDPEIAEIERNMPRKKRASVQSVTAHATYVLRHIDVLMAFYGAKRFRNLRFSRYCASKKKLDQLCRRLSEKGKRTLVGFGDWSIKTANGVVKGCRPGPTNRLRRELRRYATVIDIDEYRTSKTCNCCKQHSFYNMILRRRDPTTGVTKSSKIHGVLHCGTSGCLSATVNRDVNASRNILELTECLLQGRPRPAWCC